MSGPGRLLLGPARVLLERGGGAPSPYLPPVRACLMRAATYLLFSQCDAHTYLPTIKGYASFVVRNIIPAGFYLNDLRVIRRVYICNQPSYYRNEGAGKFLFFWKGFIGQAIYPLLGTLKSVWLTINGGAL